MQIQSYMIRAWAAFADDPGVNGPTKEIGWPMYNSGEATLGRLGFNNRPCLDYALPSAEIQLLPAVMSCHAKLCLWLWSMLRVELATF
jgi:hypothetical protein